MEIDLNNIKGPFSLEHTLDCGQLFRWKKLNHWWYGVVKDRVIKIKQNDKKLIFQFYPETKNYGFIERYLRLDDDLSFIYSRLGKDPNIFFRIGFWYIIRFCRMMIIPTSESSIRWSKRRSLSSSAKFICLSFFIQSAFTDHLRTLIQSVF